MRRKHSQKEVHCAGRSTLCRKKYSVRCSGQAEAAQKTAALQAANHQSRLRQTEQAAEKVGATKARTQLTSPRWRSEAAGALGLPQPQSATSTTAGAGLELPERATCDLEEVWRRWLVALETS